jgi:calcium-activated chloride channel regulator 4
LFAHEWGHYRWGVYDEYPTDDNAHFYADEEGNIEAVRCVRNIPGRLLVPRTGEPCSINSNGYPELACRYIDDREATGYTGSLMYKQFLPRITSFCEKESNGVSQANAHNPDAPNLQNVRCDRKSVWEVMLEHQDFAALKEENDVRTPRADDELVPSVKLVKKRSIRLVLVLDISGSMKGQRLTQLRQVSPGIYLTIKETGYNIWIQPTHYR